MSLPGNNIVCSLCYKITIILKAVCFSGFYLFKPDHNCIAFGPKLFYLFVLALSLLISKTWQQSLWMWYALVSWMLFNIWTLQVPVLEKLPLKRFWWSRPESSASPVCPHLKALSWLVAPHHRLSDILPLLSIHFWNFVIFHLPIMMVKLKFPQLFFCSVAPPSAKSRDWIFVGRT